MVVERYLLFIRFSRGAIFSHMYFHAHRMVRSGFVSSTQAPACQEVIQLLGLRAKLPNYRLPEQDFLTMLPRRTPPILRFNV
jgi:hypothetical protein